jgi:hypothetical protein
LSQIDSWIEHRSNRKNQGDQIPLNKILKDEIKKLKDKKKQLSKKGPYLKTKNKRINKNFELNDKIKKTNQINKMNPK